MKRLISVFVVAILTSCSVALYAQDTSQEQNASQETEPNAETDAEVDTEKKTAKIETEKETATEEKKDLEGQASAADSGEFVPSEEISEDVPVSFPVDI